MHMNRRQTAERPHMRQGMKREPLLWTLCALSLFFCIFNTGLTLPLSVAGFALLWRYETPKRFRFFGAAVLAIATGALLDPAMLPLVVITPLIGMLLAHLMLVGCPKFDSTCVLVGLLIVALVAEVWIRGAMTIGSFAPADVLAHGRQAMDSLREQLIEWLRDLLTAAGSSVTDTLSIHLETLADGLLGCIPAVLAILFLVEVGMACKIFAFGVHAIDEKEARATARWHFTPPVLFAYVYIVLFVASLLLPVTSGTAGLVITNLEILFMCVFAYVGYKYLRFVLRRVRRRSLLMVLMVLMVLFASEVALRILSVEGLIAVFTAHRIGKSRGQAREDHEG